MWWLKERDPFLGRELLNFARQVDKVGLGVLPVPVQRSGSSVLSVPPYVMAADPIYRAQEMAGTVIYLVSPAGCYTNGQEIAVDGGYLCVNPSRA